MPAIGEGDEKSSSSIIVGLGYACTTTIPSSSPSSPRAEPALGASSPRCVCGSSAPRMPIVRMTSHRLARDCSFSSRSSWPRRPGYSRYGRITKPVYRLTRPRATTAVSRFPAALASRSESVIRGNISGM